MTSGNLRDQGSPRIRRPWRRYLGSGAVKGPSRAGGQIVRRFKARYFPYYGGRAERLSEVKGISEKMAMAISEQVEGEGDAPIHDVPPEIRHFHESGRENLSGIYLSFIRLSKENPYQLADDIAGVGSDSG